MVARRWLWMAGLAWFALGCGWSRTVLAQGSVLLPPPTQQEAPRPVLLPLQQPVTARPPDSIIQASGPAPRGEVRSRVVARVNGEPILAEEQLHAASEFIEFVLKPQNVPPQIIERDMNQIMSRVLDELVTREAILQDAVLKIPAGSFKKVEQAAGLDFAKKLKKETEQFKLKSEDEIKEHYQKQGRSLDLMRRQYIRNSLAMEWIRNLARDRIDQETTRERVLEYYQSHPEEFKLKERVVWQHIYVDVDRYQTAQAARQVAETVWQLLRNAKTEAEFNELVEKYADGVSKARRGSGEGNHRGDIKPKELERFVWEQPSGGQGPVVETSRGYHIFRVLEHTPDEIVTFEKAGNDIKRKLENKILNEEYLRMSKEMKARAYVEILTGN